jgi:hypothetical protein
MIDRILRTRQLRFSTTLLLALAMPLATFAQDAQSSSAELAQLKAQMELQQKQLESMHREQQKLWRGRWMRE